jgi:hypothetical protein
MNNLLTMAVAGALALATAGASAAPAHLGGAPLALPSRATTTFTARPQAPVAPASNLMRTQAVHQTGQPNASCGSASAPTTPGNSMTAPGSAFNPDGKAGTVYAGEQPQNSRNPVSVSQYDAACLHQP